MGVDIFKAIDMQILFLLRDMYPNKKDLPHKKELIKIKTLLRKVSLNENDYFNLLDAPFVTSESVGSVRLSINNDEHVPNSWGSEMRYVFHEATLFLSEVLKSLISYYLNNELIEIIEPKEGSRVPVELSIVIWYGNLLEDIVNDRLIHDSVSKTYITLWQYRNEFESKKLNEIKNAASGEFKTILSEMSETERAKFGDILNGTMKGISNYYDNLQTNVKVELDRLKEGNDDLNKITSGSEFYKSKIKQVYEDCETRKASIDAVFFASKKQGMAKSFQDMAVELQHSIKIWLGVFILSLGAVAWNGYILNRDVNQQLQSVSIKMGGGEKSLKAESMIDKNNKGASMTPDINSNSNAEFLSVKAMAVRVLMMAPFLWLAWFSGRQYSHCNRLRQDYIYKGAIAMAYQGYKEESTEVGSDMHSKLLENIVEHFSDNPVRLYDKCEPSSPLEDLFKKLSPEGVAELIKALKAK
ncbi:hypothetical protein [Aeromonas dhakensis]|uniref:hypothetical protein n=1 Tax=Aeromonas dhakensis TaxID=196024 RepID=UPI003F745330